MVIYFKSEKALSHLLRNGFVYTLRAVPRKRCCRKEAVKSGRKGKPVAYGIVRFVDRVNIATEREKLEKYVEHSGFSSVDEWIEEFRRLNGAKTIGYLYRVELVARGGDHA